jgi:hypothetical protein
MLRSGVLEPLIQLLSLLLGCLCSSFLLPNGLSSLLLCSGQLLTRLRKQLLRFGQLLPYVLQLRLRQQS